MQYYKNMNARLNYISHDVDSLLYLSWSWWAYGNIAMSVYLTARWTYFVQTLQLQMN